MSKAEFTPDRRGELFDRCSRVLLAELIRNDTKLDESIFQLTEQLQVSDKKSESHLDDIPPAPYLASDFLVVDVRSEDEFAACHILNASWFSLSLLRQDKMDPLLFSIRSNPAKVVILYEMDEKIAIVAAEMLIGKGFPSVAILTGGLNRFYDKFPEMCDGSLPKQKSITKVLSSSKPLSTFSSSTNKLNKSTNLLNASPISKLKAKLVSEHPEVSSSFDSMSMMSGFSMQSRSTSKVGLSLIKR